MDGGYGASGRVPAAEAERPLSVQSGDPRGGAGQGRDTAWSEHDWINGEISLGAVRLRVISPITRCAATQVNPATAERDLDIVGALGRAFGHTNMGVYAEVMV